PEKLDERIENLCFNSTVYVLSKNLEADVSQKTRHAAGNALMVGLSKAESQVTQAALTFSASVLLAPLGIDPAMIKETVKYVIAPLLPKSAVEDRIEVTNGILDVSSPLIDTINRCGAKAFATLTAKQMEKDGKLDQLKAELKAKALEVFYVPLPIDYREVGFFSAMKNIALNIVRFCCATFSQLGDESSRNLTHLFQQVVYNANINVSIPDMAKDLNIELTQQKYWSTGEKTLEAAIAAKNGVSNLASWLHGL
ncbi:MAG: hypothetical protein ACXWM7_08040, partial [Parachlamydiaceae bacterium]